MSDYTQEDFADALRDLIANAQDPDLTDADLGNWVRLYIGALKAGLNPAAVASLMKAAEKVLLSGNLQRVGAGDGSTYVYSGLTPAAMNALATALTALRGAQ